MAYPKQRKSKLSVITDERFIAMMGKHGTWNGMAREIGATKQGLTDHLKNYRPELHKTLHNMLTITLSPEAKKLRHKQQTAEWRAANKEHVRNYNRRYRINNPDKARLKDFRSYSYRTKTKMNEDARDYVKLIINDPCSYCGGESDTIDHIIPISKGGDSSWDNLAPACRSCNSSKQDKSPLLFLLERKKEVV